MPLNLEFDSGVLLVCTVHLLQSPNAELLDPMGLVILKMYFRNDLGEWWSVIHPLGLGA